MSEFDDSAEFWERLALQLAARRSHASPSAQARPSRHDAGEKNDRLSRPDAGEKNDRTSAGLNEPEQEELESLLWGFVEDLLDDPELERLAELGSRTSDLAGVLRRVDAIRCEIARIPASSAEHAWARLQPKGVSLASTATVQAATPFTGLVELVVKLTQQGLELLKSTGQPAFPAVLVRSGGREVISTVSERFLVSGGIICLTIDRKADQTCDVSVKREAVAHRSGKTQFQIEVQREGVAEPIGVFPGEGEECRVSDLVAGRYQFSLISDPRLPPGRVLVEIREATS